MWTLPPEREDEPETVRLRRNLYWLVRVAARREECLATRLDVEARSSLENERLARMDPLTGVFNRRHFDEYLVGCLGCPVAGRVCLLFIDCDDFKAVNDGHGHESGDEVLRRLGDLLSGAVRDGADCAFRYGGDEFAVVLRGRDREDARIVAERVRARFEREGLYGTTLSIGVAECACGCAGGDVARRLVGDADAAVYEAKRRGRNRVVAAWDLRLDAEAREVVTEAS
nr:GGDEF domain-containing protein [Desulfobaculum xiamenense]